MLLLLQDQGRRIVGRPVDVNLLERVGGRGAAGHQRPDCDQRTQSAP